MPYEDSGSPLSGPVVISVPHAGRDYPADIADRLTVPLDRVRVLEDRHVDLLVRDCVAEGRRVIIARAPRLLVDLNRAETDIERLSGAGADGLAFVPSWRARGGLGIIPRSLAGVGPLWRDEPTADELVHRLRTVHRPYHTAVAGALADARREHGVAMLVDLHSMPSLKGRDAAEIVIGDLNGRAANAAIVESVSCAAHAYGLRVAVNRPYSGGHLIERHARPWQRLFAVQIEIDRRLYLDSQLNAAGQGVERMNAVVTAMVDATHQAAMGSPSLLAAE